MTPRARNDASMWFLSCLLLLLRWRYPGGFKKLFNSLQKFTLPPTAAWQAFRNTHISQVCAPRQRFSVSRIADAALGHSALVPRSSIPVCQRRGQCLRGLTGKGQIAVIHYKHPSKLLVVQKALSAIQPIKC